LNIVRKKCLPCININHTVLPALAMCGSKSLPDSRGRATGRK